jgi:hypothetical protein
MADGVRAPGVTREVTAAVTLMAVRVGLGLAVAASQVGHAGAVRSAIASANPPLSSAQVDTVYHGVVGVAVIAGGCYAALYAVLAVHLRRGHPWARNAVRLLAGLSALAALGSLREATPAAGHPLAAAILVLDAAILALLTVRRAVEPHA